MSRLSAVGFPVLRGGEDVKDVRTAAQVSRKYLTRCKEGNIQGGESTSIEYVAAMLTSIETGAVAGEKAHLWLGWAQAVICCRGGATLEEMKAVNHAA